MPKQSSYSVLVRTLAVAGVLLAAASPAFCEVISTSEALALERSSDGAAAAHEIVDTFFAREDVARQLSTLGVDPEMARIRADALSDTELLELAGRIEEMPAGGDAIAVLGVTFLVLLVLELVGVIDIFKKI
jgi:hypothetical protein